MVLPSNETSFSCSPVTWLAGKIELIAGDRWPSNGGHQSFRLVFQLPCVSGPGIMFQTFCSRWRKFLYGFMRDFAVFGEKMLSDDRDLPAISRSGAV